MHILVYSASMVNANDVYKVKHYHLSSRALESLSRAFLRFIDEQAIGLIDGLDRMKSTHSLFFIIHVLISSCLIHLMNLNLNGTTSILINISIINDITTIIIIIMLHQHRRHNHQHNRHSYDHLHYHYYHLNCSSHSPWPVQMFIAFNWLPARMSPQMCTSSRGQGFPKLPANVQRLRPRQNQWEQEPRLERARARLIDCLINKRNLFKPKTQHKKQETQGHNIVWDG